MLLSHESWQIVKCFLPVSQIFLSVEDMQQGNKSNKKMGGFSHLLFCPDFQDFQDFPFPCFLPIFPAFSASSSASACTVRRGVGYWSNRKGGKSEKPGKS
jgi:hypothetical protein